MAMSGCRLRGDGADSQHRPRVDGGGLKPLRRTRTPTGDPAAQQQLKSLRAVKVMCLSFS